MSEDSICDRIESTLRFSLNVQQARAICLLYIRRIPRVSLFSLWKFPRCRIFRCIFGRCTYIFYRYLFPGHISHAVT